MAKEINLFDFAGIDIPKESENDLQEMQNLVNEAVVEDVPQGAPEVTIVTPYIRSQVKRIIEALLFVSSEPLTLVKIREITDTAHPLRPKILTEIIEELKRDFINQNRAFRLEEIANGFLLRTCEDFKPFVELLYRNKRSEKLTQASLEVLAIIAYRQPITRPQIEAIRGVDSSGIVQNLLERQLIEPVGRLEVPGRPTLYSITQDFLKHFGLRSLHDLPRYSSEQLNHSEK